MGFSLSPEPHLPGALISVSHGGLSHILGLALFQAPTHVAFIHSQIYTQVEVGEMVGYNRELFPSWNLYFRCIIKDSLDSPLPSSALFSDCTLYFSGMFLLDPACVTVIKPQVITHGARNLEWWFSEFSEGLITHR